MGPEVLIYINKLKKYFETNNEARNYFIGHSDIDVFFDNVSEIAEKNFMEKGDPTLSMDQFEIVKKMLKIKEITERDEDYYKPTIFIDERGLEKIERTG
jgi:hypothetical protein